MKAVNSICDIRQLKHDMMQEELKRRHPDVVRADTEWEHRNRNHEDNDDDDGDGGEVTQSELF